MVFPIYWVWKIKSYSVCKTHAAGIIECLAVMCVCKYMSLFYKSLSLEKHDSSQAGMKRVKKFHMNNMETIFICTFTKQQLQ